MTSPQCRLAACALVLGCSSATAALTTFEDETTFQNALRDPLRFVNLDAPPFDVFIPTFPASDPAVRSAFEGVGIRFAGIDPRIIGGQQGQIVKPGRDRLLANGDGFEFYGDAVNSGNVVINLQFATAFGAWTNMGDVGSIVVYGGENRTGAILGEVEIGSGQFGGLVSTVPFRSVEIRCEQGDHKCGLFDLQLAVSAVPEPSMYMNVAVALGLLGFARRMRRPRLGV